jgi:uncharacterized protein YfaS (alpha-2-macroglobulin family)
VLRQPAEILLSVPEDAIEGSLKAQVKVYPSSFGQLVEGLDAIFHRPYGCFEQTSSTTYPNVLALDYLRRTHKSVPAVEAKARQYIHLGYQRLVSFEIAGGGFDWFGHAPANRVLTAYGLMEFEDMARVHDVDPALIARTRSWLLDQQRGDGAWDPEGHELHSGPITGRDPRLGTTAYIAWAVFRNHAEDPKAHATLAYLQAAAPRSIDDPYVLALVASAVQALDPAGNATAPYLDRLAGLAQTSPDGHLACWAPANRRILFYGAGPAGAIESTAMASLALLLASRPAAATRGALTWLIAQKDAQGTWFSTQATVLALKALLAGTDAALDDGRARRITIALDGVPARDLVIAGDQSDVVQVIELTDRLTPGSHRLTLDDRNGSGSGYQVVFSYHEPGAGAGAGGPPPAPPDANEPLTIQIAYDRTTLAVDDLVTATASVVNRRSEPAPMVILDLPVPAGFAVEADDLTAAVTAGSLAKFQLTPRSAIVYLRDLEPGRPFVLRYRLRATMPVKVAVPPAQAYEYYDPGRRGSSARALFTVLPASSERGALK